MSRTWLRCLVPVCTAFALAACVSTSGRLQSASASSRPATAATPTAAPLHPLDPLTPAEIELTAGLVRARGGFGASDPNVFFPLLVLAEPEKDVVHSFAAAGGADAGSPAVVTARRAFAVVLDRDDNRTFEAEVDLRAGAVEAWREVPGVQPNLLFDEFDSLQDVVRQDPRWQARCARAASRTSTTC